MPTVAVAIPADTCMSASFDQSAMAQPPRDLLVEWLDGWVTFSSRVNVHLQLRVKMRLVERDKKPSHVYGF